MSADVQRTVTEPAQRWELPPLRQLWDYRDLVYLLARRDVAVRYKQTVIGALWAVVQPVSLAIVFSVFLGFIARLPAPEGVPYAVFALAGMTLWLMFAGALTRTADSTLSSVALISKVYFPRVIIPIAAVLAPVVDFAVAFVVLLVALAIYGVELQVNLLLTPVMLALAVMVALGAGLWLSALAVRYRDIQQLVPFTIQVLLFATPVLYPLSQVPEDVQWVYALNPLVGVMEGFRWATLPGADAPGWMLVIPAVTGILILVSGLFYFQSAEQDFADVI